jgi:hypothetical protein
MAFYEWAIARKTTNTPRGDFLADMRSDKVADSIVNTKKAWIAHLEASGACDGAIKAFKSIWREYARANP